MGKKEIFPPHDKNRQGKDSRRLSTANNRSPCHDAIVDENVIMEVLSSFLAGNNDAPVVEKIND